MDWSKKFCMVDPARPEDGMHALHFAVASIWLSPVQLGQLGRTLRRAARQGFARPLWTSGSDSDDEHIRDAQGIRVTQGGLEFFMPTALIRIDADQGDLANLAIQIQAVLEY